MTKNNNNNNTVTNNTSTPLKCVHVFKCVFICKVRSERTDGLIGQSRITYKTNEHSAVHYLEISYKLWFYHTVCCISMQHTHTHTFWRITTWSWNLIGIICQNLWLLMKNFISTFCQFMDPSFAILQAHFYLEPELLGGGGVWHPWSTMCDSVKAPVCKTVCLSNVHRFKQLSKALQSDTYWKDYITKHWKTHQSGYL